MRMQEVIAKLREEAPLLEKCAKNTDVLFNKAWGLFDDFRRAESDAGRMILADAVCTALNEFAGEYRTLRCSVETVCMVNAEYREKLGPGRRKAKSKDAPGQQVMDFGSTQQPGETHVGTYDANGAGATSVAEQGDQARVGRAAVVAGTEVRQ